MSKTLTDAQEDQVEVLASLLQSSIDDAANNWIDLDDCKAVAHRLIRLGWGKGPENLELERRVSRLETWAQGGRVTW